MAMREASLASKSLDDTIIDNSSRLSEVVFLRSLAALSEAHIFEKRVVLMLLTGDQSNESIFAYAELLNPPETIQRLRNEMEIDESKLGMARLRIPAFQPDDVLAGWDAILSV